MSENQVVNACLRWLIMNGVFAWRNNSGGYKPENSNRYIRYGFKGSPDIIGMTKKGVFLGIEAKFGSNSQSPSQRAFQAQAEKNNGLYLVVRSLDDLEAHRGEILA